MTSRRLSTGFLLGGLALLGVAAFDYLTPGDSPGVTIAEPNREFPACPAGQVVPVAFHIQNPTRHTTRILGLTPC
jgi:hypothetical protein